jgi:hypothetical protein
MVLLEGLGQLKNLMNSSGIEPATFRLVAYCLNQLRYRLPHDQLITRIKAAPQVTIRWPRHETWMEVIIQEMHTEI